MIDTYQAIYDGVRSRMSNGDVGAAVSDAALRCFDLGYLKEHAQQEVYRVSGEWTRPSVLYRPALSADGNKWCALLGDNLQDGIAGFGDTAAEAMTAFDMAFWNERTPASARQDSAE